MNRRGFLKGVFSALVAPAMARVLSAALPVVEVARKIIVNPAYQAAEVETTIIFNPLVFGAAKYVAVKDPFPKRYNFVDGKWAEVQPFIEADENIP